jgi:hypothetical protein
MGLAKEAKIAAMSWAILLLVGCVGSGPRLSEGSTPAHAGTPSASGAPIGPGEVNGELLRRSKAHRFPKPVRYRCGDDDCAGSASFLRLRTPRSHDRVDIVMTFTIEYRAKGGDALLQPGVRRADGGTRPSMEPGDFHLTPTGRTTTTVSWMKEGLRAGGRAYRFGVGLSPAMPAFGEPIARLVVYSFTHVVDVTPSSDQH